MTANDDNCIADGTARDRLGQLVREVWVEWAARQPSPKPSWLVPWEQLDEPDREVDRLIGERLFQEGQRSVLVGDSAAGQPEDSLHGDGLVGSDCEPQPCGQVWSSDCPVMVGPPNWSHDDHPDLATKISVAFEVYNSPAIWRSFSLDEDVRVRHRVAANPHCPPDVLDTLSQDLNVTVRCAVADNHSCPPAILQYLIADTHEAVCLYVAANPNCPARALNVLLRHPSARVQQRAASHPNLPAPALAMWQLAHDQP